MSERALLDVAAQDHTAGESGMFVRLLCEGEGEGMEVVGEAASGVEAVLIALKEDPSRLGLSYTKSSCERTPLFVRFKSS